MDDEKLISRTSDVDNELCKCIIAEYYDVYGCDVVKLDGYEDLNFHLLPPVFRKSNHSSDDDNWPHGCVLKIINSQQSENIAFIEAYINVLLHLSKEKISDSAPIKNKYGHYYSHWTYPSKNKNDRKHIIIMLNYQNGEELQLYKCDERIAFSLGQLASNLHSQLTPFRHVEAFKRPNFSWNLESVPILRNTLSKIEISANQKSFIERVLDEFESRVLSKLDHLEKGVIHNDLNDRNLLVERLAVEKLRIKLIGILDFTDMVYTAYIFEIAIASCYLSLNNPDADPINLTASLVAGYERRHLTDMEYSLLKICICMRFAQSLVKGLHTHSLDPSNVYSLTTQKLGWKLLYMFYDMNNEFFVDQIRQLVDTKQTTV